MNKFDAIINYIQETYSPKAIIVYGSYSDGSANANSDFDALVITDSIKKHDSSEVDGTILDVWVYPASSFSDDYDPYEFIQVFDGHIVLDKEGTAEKLKASVKAYIDEIPLKTAEEIKQGLDWCEKMYLRTLRGDAEGFYRWHWLLFDSLEIYFDIKKLHYFGPKKALRCMESTDPVAFNVYSAALTELSSERLSEWISYLKSLFD